MNYKVFGCLLALSVGLGVAEPAKAATFDQTLLDVYGDFDGDDLEYDFTGLPSAGADGTLRLFTGVAQASIFDGLDLTGTGDFFDLIIDSIVVGRFSCDGNTGSTVIPGCTTSPFDNEFDFSLSFSSLGLDLPSLVADGSLLVVVDFSDDVNFSNEKDELFVQLTYDEADIPEPISLLGTALAGGLGLMYRRNRVNSSSSD